MDQPPPRYRIESDSSDEEGHGVYPSSGAGAKPVEEHSYTITSKEEILTAQSAVVGIGQAGKYLVRRVRGDRVLEIAVNGSPVGAGLLVEGCVFIIIEEVATADAFEVAKRITGVVRVSNWTLFSAYVPAMYIPPPGERVTDTPQIRVLSSTKQRSYRAPNYVTGIAGAFLTLAAHPASRMDATLNLLPLPLSSLPTSVLTETISTLPSPLAAQLSQPSRWTEEDDERFAGPGMGLKPQHSQPANDSMYM